MKKQKPMALAVACPTCGRQATQSCITENGKETTVHKPRELVYKATRQLAKRGLRGSMPDHYEVQGLIRVHRSELDPTVTDEALMDARISGRELVDNYIVETFLDDQGAISHVIEKDGQRIELNANVTGYMHSQVKTLMKVRDEDREAQKILARYLNRGSVE